MMTEIHQTCRVCEKIYTLEVDLKAYNSWKTRGELIQNALPELSDGERELLISGTCESCFDMIFKTHEGAEVPCDQKCDAMIDAEHANQAYEKALAELKEKLHAANMKLSVAKELFLYAKTECMHCTSATKPQCEADCKLSKTIKAWEKTNG